MIKGSLLKNENRHLRGLVCLLCSVCTDTFTVGNKKSKKEKERTLPFAAENALSSCLKSVTTETSHVSWNVGYVTKMRGVRIVKRTSSTIITPCPNTYMYFNVAQKCDLIL